MLDGLILPPGFRASGARLELNDRAPINFGQIGFWPLNGTSSRVENDISSFGRRLAATTPPTRSVDRYGRATTFDRTASQAFTANATLGISSLNEFTFSARVFLPNTSSHGEMFQIGTTGLDGFGFGLGNTEFENSGNNLLILFNGVAWFRPGVSVGAGSKQLTYVLTENGWVRRIYIDAVEVWTSGFVSSPLAVGSAGASSVTIGGYTTGGTNRHFTGTMQAVRAWNRGLRPSEIGQLAADQWAGTIDPVTRLFFAVGEASALPPLTADSTQTLTVSGTIASTLALAGASTQTLATTGTIAGTVGLAGVSTATLAITGAAAGTLALSGASTATLAVTGAAAGAVSLAATSSQTLAITGSITAVNPYVEAAVPPSRTYALPALPRRYALAAEPRTYRLRAAPRRYPVPPEALPMPPIQLREQHPGDILDHAVKFADWLDGDDLATAAVSVGSGITLTPSGKPAPAISGDDVVFWLGGGATGTTYNIQVTVTTTGGRTRVVDCQIPIIDPTP